LNSYNVEDIDARMCRAGVHPPQALSFAPTVRKDGSRNLVVATFRLRNRRLKPATTDYKKVKIFWQYKNDNGIIVLW